MPSAQWNLINLQLSKGAAINNDDDDDADGDDDVS